MAYFPFMMDIRDKDCLVVGGGAVAYRKVLDLVQFDARVTVEAPAFCDAIMNLSDVEVITKKYETDDISGRFLVIAATDDAQLNRDIAKDCDTRQILVNAVDMKESCSFIFPAILKQDELVVSISTGGCSPAGAAYLKSKIKDAIPNEYAKNLELLGDYRDEIKNNIPEPELRKKLYYDLLELADREQRILRDADILEYMNTIKKIGGM